MARSTACMTNNKHTDDSDKRCKKVGAGERYESTQASAIRLRRGKCQSQLLPINSRTRHSTSTLSYVSIAPRKPRRPRARSVGRADRSGKWRTFRESGPRIRARDLGGRSTADISRRNSNISPVRAFPSRYSRRPPPRSPLLLPLPPMPL